MRSSHRPGKNQSSGPPSSSSAVREGSLWEGGPLSLGPGLGQAGRWLCSAALKLPRSLLEAGAGGKLFLGPQRSPLHRAGSGAGLRGRSAGSAVLSCGVLRSATTWEPPQGASLGSESSISAGTLPPGLGQETCSGFRQGTCLVPALPPCSDWALSLAGTVGVQISGLQEYGAMGGSTHAVSAAMWACQHCTFMNQPGTDHCEMCSLPRT